MQAVSWKLKKKGGRLGKKWHRTRSYDKLWHNKLLLNILKFSSWQLPLSSIFFTKWTAYALYERVRKCGWSSSNTASPSACEQCLTHVYWQGKKQLKLQAIIM